MLAILCNWQAHVQAHVHVHVHVRAHVLRCTGDACHACFEQHGAPVPMVAVHDAAFSHIEVQQVFTCMNAGNRCRMTPGPERVQSGRRHKATLCVKFGLGHNWRAACMCLAARFMVCRNNQNHSMRAGTTVGKLYPSQITLAH